MIKKFTILTLLFGPAFFVSYGQNLKPDPADKFLNFLNHYQVDSLQTLLADNFQLKRTYTTYVNDRKSFIEKYVPYSKNFNATYKILSTERSGQMTAFLVEDQSDYLKYLNIEYPKWKVQITMNEKEKVERMTIDTTGNYQAYMAQTREKSEQFERWLKQKYPNETIEILYTKTRLLTQRLKEYSIK